MFLPLTPHTPTHNTNPHSGNESQPGHAPSHSSCGFWNPSTTDHHHHPQAPRTSGPPYACGAAMGPNRAALMTLATPAALAASPSVLGALHSPTI
jgi:hypothetical protein